ncbi:hypothetical protein BGX27_005777 [Mortierella sp. AM989]|nr:hypothetical protein BGX27_005777 [Mortierella sp. AM989]
MNRAHSYSQVPVSETTDAVSGNEPRISEEKTNNNDNNEHRNNLAFARSQKSPVNNTSASGNRMTIGANTTTGSTNTIVNSNNSKGKDRRGYAALDHNDDDDDEFEDAQEDSVMLRPLASSSAASGSAPRRPVYPNNDDDDEDDDHNENEISVAIPTEGSSSSPNGKITSDTAAKKNSGARTTNMSFLARLTGRQRPERDAQRMVRSAVDGVFSNLSAKPRVEKPYEEELPPAYKTAAMDVSPAYHETMLPPGFTDDDDMLLVEGLPVGGLFGFLWNMIISMTFQFVGFFLTYLLHTSHSTKEGSKTGLGITLISMGYRLMNGKLPTDDEDYSDGNTGYMGNVTPSPRVSMGFDYDWLSYLILILGVVVVIQSVSAFTRVKLSEIRVTLAAHAAAHEATVSAGAAAGTSSTQAPSRDNGAVIIAML